MENTDTEDSDAVFGATIFTDNTSIDSGHNRNWQFNTVYVTYRQYGARFRHPGKLGRHVLIHALCLRQRSTFVSVQINKLGIAPDNDVKLVRIYRESGSTPGFQPLQDTLVVEADNNVFSGGTVTIPMTTSPNQVIGATPVTYYVVLDINDSFIGSPNDAIAVQISSNTSFSFSAGGGAAGSDSRTARHSPRLLSSATR